MLTSEEKGKRFPCNTGLITSVHMLEIGPLQPCLVDFRVSLIHTALHPLLANPADRFLTWTHDHPALLIPTKD